MYCYIASFDIQSISKCSLSRTLNSWKDLFKYQNGFIQTKYWLFIHNLYEIRIEHSFIEIKFEIDLDILVR